MENFIDMRAEMNAEWDRQLAEMISSGRYDYKEPILPREIQFPIMVAFHRKKVSQRNTWYLMVAVCHSIGDVCSIERNLAHKGWGTMAMTFDAPQWMIQRQSESNRNLYWRFQDWADMSRIMSISDRVMVDDLNDQYPCPTTQIKNKKGQYTLIF